MMGNNAIYWQFNDIRNLRELPGYRYSQDRYVRMKSHFLSCTFMQHARQETFGISDHADNIYVIFDAI